MFHAEERYRLTKFACKRWGFPEQMANGPENGNNGYFYIPRQRRVRPLAVICSDEELWEHVSVHCVTFTRANHQEGSTPNWEEMCFVKDLWWDPEDVVMQLHPARTQYVNMHPHTLHLWRPVPGSGLFVPTPPSWMVGPREGQTIQEAALEARRETGGRV